MSEKLIDFANSLIESDIEEEINQDELKLLYVKYKGSDIDGRRTYQFLFGTDEQKENFWAEGFNEKPSGIAGEFIISDSQYELFKELKVYNIRLDLAYENMCFSMQDCRDNCVALAYENLDNIDNDPDFVYPENGRLVFHFGMLYVDVELILAKRDLLMSFI